MKTRGKIREIYSPFFGFIIISYQTFKCNSFDIGTIFLERKRERRGDKRRKKSSPKCMFAHQLHCSRCAQVISFFIHSALSTDSYCLLRGQYFIINLLLLLRTHSSNKKKLDGCCIRATTIFPPYSTVKSRHHQIFFLDSYRRTKKKKKSLFFLSP